MDVLSLCDEPATEPERWWPSARAARPPADGAKRGNPVP